MLNNSFVLFADCLLTQGVNRSIICDTRNNRFHLIPNALCEILERFNGKTIDHVKAQYEKEHGGIIDEYFDFLLSENLVFFTKAPELFPRLDLQWDSPSLITNIIIDYKDVEHDFSGLLPQFENLLCSNLQVRFFRETSISFIEQLLQLLKDYKSRITSIDFIFPFQNSFELQSLQALIKKFPRIHALIVYNAPENISSKPLRESMGYVMMVDRNIMDERSCGRINPEYFYSNIKLFSESQNFNTCLNRKMAIDKEGNIKNCPSMAHDYGNIKDTNLIQVLSNKRFKDLWNLSKDEIDICKNCEFRHVCTDCRAYIQDPHNLYSKPLKCGYDPHTNQWEEWSSNPLKEKAILYYGLRECL